MLFACTAPADAVLGIDAPDHVGADAGQRVVLDHGDAGFSIATTVAVGRVVHVDDRVHAVGARRAATARAPRPRGSAAARAGRRAAAGSMPRRRGADPGAARERQSQRDDQRRQHRPPTAIAGVEEQPRQAGADDQHQRTGVRHPVRQRALQPPPEVVVVEDAVLDDADERARGADGDDHGQTCRRARRARSRRRPGRAGKATAACSR